MKSKKKIISLIVSLTILIFIYCKIDFPGLIKVFQNSHPTWMAISLLTFIPLTLLTAWRLRQLMPTKSIILTNQIVGQSQRIELISLTFLEANKLILAASVLNMILPSKMGDIAKAYFMQKRGHLSGSLSLSLVIFEKTCDMLSLLLWCVFGLLLYPQKDFLFWLMTWGVGCGLLFGLLLLSSRSFAHLFFKSMRTIVPVKMRRKLDEFHLSWLEMHSHFWRNPRQLVKIITTSIVIWFGHLLQIWLFILALNAWTPFLANLAIAPLAILAGLLPLTFAGVGTRDVALILFYQPYFAAPTAAALGILCTSRYLLPAIAGLPFLHEYLVGVKDWQQSREN